MINGEVGRVGASDHVQAGGDRALAGRKQRAHDQNEKVPPGRGRKMRAKRLQPQAKNQGYGIAVCGG